MRLPIADAMLFEHDSCLVLVGRDPHGHWVSTGNIASIDYRSGLLCDSHGCEYHATWAPPDQVSSVIKPANSKDGECWQRVARFRANLWQRQFGWAPKGKLSVAKAEYWEVVAVGGHLYIAGLLIGDPQSPDGWGTTTVLSHLELDANFAVTANDQQRWHLGTQGGGSYASRLEELLNTLRQSAAAEDDVFILDANDLAAFRCRPYVSKP